MAAHFSTTVSTTPLAVNDGRAVQQFGASSLVELVGSVQRHLTPELWITDAQLHKHYQEKAMALDATFADRCANAEKHWKDQVSITTMELEDERRQHNITKASLRVMEASHVKEQQQSAALASSYRVAEVAHSSSISRLEARAAELEEAFLDSQRALAAYEMALLSLVDKKAVHDTTNGGGNTSGAASPRRISTVALTEAGEGFGAPSSFSPLWQRRRSTVLQRQSSAVDVTQRRESLDAFGPFYTLDHNPMSEKAGTAYTKTGSQTQLLGRQPSQHIPPLSPSPVRRQSMAASRVFGDDELLSAEDIVAVINKQRAVVSNKMQSLQADLLLQQTDNAELKRRVAELAQEVQYWQGRARLSATGARSVGSRGPSARRAPTTNTRRPLVASPPPFASQPPTQSARSTAASSFQPRGSTSSALARSTTAPPSQANGEDDEKHVRSSDNVDELRQRRLGVIDGMESILIKLELSVAETLASRGPGNNAATRGRCDEEKLETDDDGVSICPPPETPTLLPIVTSNAADGGDFVSTLLSAHSSFEVLVDLHRQIQRKDLLVSSLEARVRQLEEDVGRPRPPSRTHRSNHIQLVQLCL